jgi:hypothetical protein
VDFLDFARGVQIVLAGFCLIFGTIRTLLVVKDLSRGQKLLFTSTFMFLLTSIWDTYDLLDRHEPFSFRVVPYMIGLFACYAYLMEPSRSWKQRLGREPFDPKERGEL